MVKKKIPILINLSQRPIVIEKRFARQKKSEVEVNYSKSFLSKF